MSPLVDPPFDLDEPGTLLFTAERAFHGRHVTAFCLSLREERHRDAYLADPRGYMARYPLSEDERRLVEARDWTGLMRCGGHLQAVSKLVAAHGGNLFDIGAHNAGVTVAELVAACPRVVSRLPGED